MIYGYIRTSTEKQNNENQHFEINSALFFCKIIVSKSIVK